jgi:hypothetical protein
VASFTELRLVFGGVFNEGTIGNWEIPPLLMMVFDLSQLVLAWCCDKAAHESKFDARYHINHQQQQQSINQSSTTTPSSNDSSINNHLINFDSL